MTIGTNSGPTPPESDFLVQCAGCIAQPIAVLDSVNAAIFAENDAMRRLDVDRESFVRSCIAAASAASSPALAFDCQGRKWHIVSGPLGLPDGDDATASRWLVAIMAAEANREAATASLDPLTGALDRRELEAWASQHWPSGAPSGLSFGLLFLDFDGFKRVNDEFGHPAGDVALATLARRLLDCIRDRDQLYRYGGDEFVVVAAGVTTHDKLDTIVRRVSRVVDEPVEIAGEPVALGLSVGGAFSGEGLGSFAELLATADQRMYANKRQSGESS